MRTSLRESLSDTITFFLSIYAQNKRTSNFNDLIDTIKLISLIIFFLSFHQNIIESSKLFYLTNYKYGSERPCPNLQLTHPMFFSVHMVHISF